MLKRIIALYLIAVTAYGADFTVNFSDLQSADWVETGVGEYRILWSDIGGVTPPAGLTPFVFYDFATNGSESTITLDISGNARTGTVSGATHIDITNGAYYSYSFDGTDYIGIGDSQSMALTDYTMQAWVLHDNASSTFDDAVMGRNTGGNNKGDFSIQWRTIDETYRYFIQDGTNTLDIVSDSAYTDVGVWHHILITSSQSGNFLRMYIDGVLQADAETYLPMVAHPSLAVGISAEAGSGAGTPRWYGDISQPNILTNSLTTQEAQSTNLIQKNIKGLVSDYLASNTNTYWQYTQLHAGLNNNVGQDGSPNNVPVVSTSNPDPKGIINEGWNNGNGSANLIQYTDTSLYANAIGNTSFTFRCWARYETAGANTHPAASNREGAGDRHGIAIYPYATGAGGYFMVVDTTDGTDSHVGVGAGANKWQHYAITRDGMLITYFIDGVVVGTDSVSGSGAINTPSYVELFHDDVGEFFDGDVDEFTYLVGKAESTNEVFTYYHSTTNTHSN